MMWDSIIFAGPMRLGHDSGVIQNSICIVLAAHNPSNLQTYLQPWNRRGTDLGSVNLPKIAWSHHGGRAAAESFTYFPAYCISICLTLS
jgi:hypothetical protein